MARGSKVGQRAIRRIRAASPKPAARFQADSAGARDVREWRPHRHRLLRPRRKRPRNCRAADQLDEFAASHFPSKIAEQKFFCSTYEQLLQPGEYDGDWARILDHLACGSEHPRHRVYSKCDNRVVLLVGRMEKAPCRVETNEAWDAALRGLPSNRGKQSVSRIGGVHSHAVVATIGAIHHPILPDVPTSKEAGLPEFQVSAWNALFAPKGTPKPILDKLTD